MACGSPQRSIREPISLMKAASASLNPSGPGTGERSAPGKGRRPGRTRRPGGLGVGFGGDLVVSHGLAGFSGLQEGDGQPVDLVGTVEIGDVSGAGDDMELAVRIAFAPPFHGGADVTRAVAFTADQKLALLDTVAGRGATVRVIPSQVVRKERRPLATKVSRRYSWAAGSSAEAGPSTGSAAGRASAA